MSLIVRAPECGHFMCDAPAVCRGLCSKHYAAKQRRENPDKIKSAKRKYHLDNRDALLEKSRVNYQATKEDRRAENYRVLYNIAVADYDKIRDFMQRHPQFHLLLNRSSWATRREAVEHRHKDGLIRGTMDCLLNQAYGLIERLYGDDTAAVLDALAEFHRNPPAPTVLGGPVYGLIGRAQKKKVMRYGPAGSVEPQPRQ